MATKDVPTKPLYTRHQRLMACGWCKGFVHEEIVSDMQRYVHDEEPITSHEVLPYPIDPAGKQWTSTAR